MSIDHVHAVRDAELQSALPWFPPARSAARVLDLGAGTGRQAANLAALGYQVTAVDLPDSNYAHQRVYSVIDYDGSALPLADGSVDVVFSSNVLEHVLPIDELLRETARVLAPGGYGIHILPTPAWRLWSNATFYPFLAKRLVIRRFSKVVAEPSGEGPAPEAPRAAGWDLLMPARHGERGNVLTETYYFSERWWRATFTRAGFDVVQTAPAALSYSGYMLFGTGMSVSVRRDAARWIGSACRMYRVRPA